MIIDIPEEVYKDIQSRSTEIQVEGCTVENVVLNGVPIPDNATNGDVIKMMFTPNQITRTGDDTVHMEYNFTPEWWNAPYQKGE